MGNTEYGIPDIPRRSNKRNNDYSDDFDYNMLESELTDFANEINNLCNALSKKYHGKASAVSQEDAVIFQVEFEQLMKRFIFGGGEVSFDRRAHTLKLMSGSKILATLLEPGILNASRSLFEGTGTIADHIKISSADLKDKGPIVYILQCKNCFEFSYTQGTYIGQSMRGCARFKEHERSIASGEDKSIVEHLRSEHQLDANAIRATIDEGGPGFSRFYIYRIVIRIPDNFPGDVKKILRTFEVFYQWFLKDISNKR